MICVFHLQVTLPDFLLADQLTSQVYIVSCPIYVKRTNIFIQFEIEALNIIILLQVQALRSLEFYICYYGWGDYKHRRNTCKTNAVYNTFYFIVAVVPYWSRLLQVSSPFLFSSKIDVVTRKK